MPRIPSSGIDQNEEGKFRDIYVGQVPKFLVYQPENNKCVVNPEYLYLMEKMKNQELVQENLPIDLWRELEFIVLNVDCPCLLTGEERAVVIAYNGGIPCDYEHWKLDCSESVCCNTMLSCEDRRKCNTTP
jgi:hypothetical protein